MSSKKIIVLIGSSYLLSCSVGRYLPFSESTPLSNQSGKLVTLTDYFLSGHEATEKFLVEESFQKNGMRETLKNCERACLRLEFQFGNEGGSFHAAEGTGVIVNCDHLGPRIFTAGHVNPGKNFEVVSTTIDGDRLDAKALGKSYQAFGSSEMDWAILSIENPNKNISGLSIAEPQTNELVFALGYPDGYGKDEKEQIAKRRDGYLTPLWTVARIQKLDPLTLTPVAGFVPLGGMSGSPIVNMNGQLVGIFTGEGWNFAKAGRVVWYTASTPSKFGKEFCSSKTD